MVNTYRAYGYSTEHYGKLIIIEAFSLEEANSSNGSWYYLHEFLYKNYCEVIGNIHENLELKELR